MARMTENLPPAACSIALVFYGGGEGDQQLAGLERGSDAADNVVPVAAA